ncbi:putative prophage protein [Escherichia coli]|nr:putative prophage protein [Escherichia coli]
MDITPVLHALCAVAAQVLAGILTGNWVYGAIAGCSFFIAREHTQAEYRWIEKFGKGNELTCPGGVVLIRACGMPEA